MIDTYFTDFEVIVSQFPMIQRQNIEKIRKDDNFGIISGSLEFHFAVLDFIEVVVFQNGLFEKTKYKYHVMDNDNNLIFRYDNAKHYPEFENFPHHKHTPTHVTSCRQPDIFDISTEIVELCTFLNE